MTSFTRLVKLSAVLGSALVLSGCVENFEGVTPARGDGPHLLAVGDDRGRDSGHLSQLEAGIYVDPDGCHIWMIDDGIEGYWSRRLDPVTGLPVCTDIAPPNSVVGDIGAGAGIRDWVPRRP